MPYYRLYDYAASGNCYKVRLLIAQLGIECERVPVDIFAGDTLTPEFAAINPARSTPVLELPDGRHLSESGAILVYLARGTHLLPEEPFEHAVIARSSSPTATRSPTSPRTAICTSLTRPGCRCATSGRCRPGSRGWRSSPGT